MADASKALMMQESARRMKLLEIPDEEITKFEAEGVPYCVSSFGYVDELDDIDIEQIKQIERDGAIVYTVIHEGMSATTYLVTSKYKGEWSGEFFPVMSNYYAGFAFVLSSMNYGSLDGGCTYLAGNGGYPKRMSMDEMR